MDITIEIAIIGLIQALMTAIIGGLFARDSRKKKKQLEKAEVRAALRAEEGRLAMKLLSADMSLTLATARAVKEGKANGFMESAMNMAEVVQREYYDFVNAVAAKQITR